MQTIVKILLIIGALFFSAYGIQTYLDGYETRKVYVEVPYQEPVYQTLYSGILYHDKNIIINTIHFPSDSFNDATYYEITDGIIPFFSDSRVRIYWNSNFRDYYEVSSWDIKSYQTKVVIGNETKYRTESSVVTKKRWDWLLS